ncbi:energy transducer TonB [Xanthomonas arboricola pv. juglandis]|uniref:TonB family protein n=1 Tax=Xanthomonas sp. CPBF 426 TaxID=2750648 RepID=UPI000E5B49C8|nr:energy transducer TonB [Xanthomonas sp. CPBF 426]SYZ51376.1 energy transducer TonB [Xanthomonas arboricola pv. juglandis]
MRQRGVSDSTRWAGSIASALLLHGGVAALMLLDFVAQPPAPVAAPLAAMTVELAPLPAAREHQLTEKPPGPEQIESRVQPKPQPRAFDPPPEVKTHPPPDALAAKLEDKPEAEQVTGADRTTAVPSSVAPAVADAALQAPVQGVASENATAVIQSWENRLLTHLEQHKRYPGAAQRRRQEDTVYLRFTMDRSGNVLQWTIWRSRGYALLDAEVDALIRRAAPLPPPPPEMTGNTVEMIVPVEFFLRRQLAQGRGP